MSTLTATVDLPTTTFTVRDARTITLALATAWSAPAAVEDLAVLVDDLTSDVVAHAGNETSLVLELSLADEVLRVGIADGSAVRPVARGETHGLPHAALARGWGEEPYRGGHRIWFELGPAPEGQVLESPVPAAEVWRSLEQALGAIRSGDDDPTEP
ncbi:hypothetical protein PHK61_08290 [Actinomycetospora lutea]|uniref:hypothetical protein n=1 Tax=Actinomycetospora lutea TaxID=663604 RepID=UPI0023665FEB|nr:hypothetical protein [Actinomycetospora lutea]MDD7938416.1 hypothetical protein [Actinomycetospora lutea]